MPKNGLDLLRMYMPRSWWPSQLISTLQARRPRIRRALLVPVLTIIAGSVGLAVIRSPLFLYILYIGVSITLGITATTTFAWMLYAWRTPESLSRSRMRHNDAHTDPAYSFSLIVPARHEEAVLERTIERILTSHHPAFEIIVVVGNDDPATHEVADIVADRHPEVVKVVVDSSWPKSKPKALNTALPYCRGTITGVFDAEDDVHPDLLNMVDHSFQHSDADVVQAGVQLMNFGSSWLTVHNVLEYYFWFGSRLHLHARQRFIPLGGNTVFVRTRVLRAVAGWDPECLAEDCELGVRLSALGARTVVCYEPEMVTREECPPTLGAFVRQRTRWSQGYLQTLSRGYWRRLPFWQRALGLYILASPFSMAFTWLLLPVAIGTAVALKAPVPITLVSFLPALPMISMLLAETVGLGEFGRTYGVRAAPRDYARLVAGLPFYQAVLAYSAIRAVVREARGHRGWDKTTHLGLHLRQMSDEEVAHPEPAQLGQRNGVGMRRALRPIAHTVLWLRGALSVRTLIGLLPTVRQAEPALAGPGMSEGLRVLEASRAVDQVADFATPARVPALLPLTRDVEPDSGQAKNWGSSDEAAHGAAPIMLTSEAEPLNRNGKVHGRWPWRAVASARAAKPGPLWLRLDEVMAGGAASVVLPRIDEDYVVADQPTRMSDVWNVLRSRIKAHVDLLVQIPLLIGLGWVQLTNMVHWPGILFDEGTYVGNAWAVGHRGALAFYTYTYGHPPLGWLPIALWTAGSALFGHGSYSVDSARALMGVLSIVSFSLVYTLARRLAMKPYVAAFAVVLFALSPLGLYFHRGVLLDNPATVWALAAFVLAMSPRRRLWSFAGSGACFAASVLSKETTLVLLPALLLAAYQNTDQRTRRYCMTLLISFFALIGLAYPLYATLKGELIPGAGHVSLIGTDINMLFTRQGTGGIFDPHSVAHGTVLSWLSLDPWLVGAALLLCPVALARRITRPIALAYLIQVAMILRPGYLPAMYVIALLPFAALIVASSVQALAQFAAGRHPQREIPTGFARWRATCWRSGKRLEAATASVCGALVLAIGAFAVLQVAPRWLQVDRSAMTVRLDGPDIAAQQWLLQHVGKNQRVIVTDDFWIFLISHGYNSHEVKGGFNSPTVVSYWPLDKDPAVRRYFPYSWREFDFIVSTEAMRVTAIDTPSTAQALQHSVVVAAFGGGGQRIEIRAITPTPLANPGTAQARRYIVPGAGVTTLRQVAALLHVSVTDLVTETNDHASAPSWWYFEAQRHYGRPLPTGTVLYYTRS